MQKQNGFTLIELTLSISIIGLLVALTIPTLFAAKDKAMSNANWVQQCQALVIEHLPERVDCEKMLGKSPNKKFVY